MPIGADMGSIAIKLRNRTARVRQHGWRMRAYRSASRHVVVGGAPGSGTTLLRRLLDRHPTFLAGPETKVFVPGAINLAWLSSAFALPPAELEAIRRDSPSQAAFIDRFAARVLIGTGKSRWVEKTPMNIQHVGWILERFPRATIVHQVRDGRDVVCSMREHPDWRWTDQGWRTVHVARSIETLAERWVADTGRGLAWRGDPRYVEVRYEELVTRPVQVLVRLCEAIGETADPDWLASVTAEAGGDASPGPAVAAPDDKGPISDASIGRWRRDLTAAEQGAVERVCGPRLRELGYESSPDRRGL